MICNPSCLPSLLTWTWLETPRLLSTAVYVLTSEEKRSAEDFLLFVPYPSPFDECVELDEACCPTVGRPRPQIHAPSPRNPWHCAETIFMFCKQMANDCLNTAFEKRDKAGWAGWTFRSPCFGIRRAFCVAGKECSSGQSNIQYFQVP